MSALVVVYLPNISGSIQWHPCLDEVQGSAILLLLLRSLKDRFPDGEVRVLCHSRLTENVLRAIGDEYRSIVMQSIGETEIDAVGEMIEVSRHDNIIFVESSFVLSPLNLLSDLIALHMSHDWKMTDVSRLPSGAAPRIVSRGVLQELIRHVPKGESAVSLSLLLRYLKGRRLHLRDYDPLSCGDLDACEKYAINPADLPERISHNDVSFSQVLRQVLSKMSLLKLSDDPAAGYRLWKEHILEAGPDAKRSLKIARRVPSANKWTGPSKLQRRRILYAQSSSGFTGAEEALCRMIAHLDHSWFEPVAIVAAPGTFANRLRESGATVHVTFEDYGGSTEHSFYAAVSRVGLLRPDLIHLNSCKERNLALAAACLGVPQVQHARLHATLYDNHAMGLADRIIAVSKVTRDAVIAHDVDPKNVRVIYDGIDTDVFRPKSGDDTFRQRLLVNRTAKLVLMIARYVPYKQHEVLLEAIALVRRRVPNVEVALIGDIFNEQEGQRFAVIRQLALRLGLDGCVHYIPFQRDIREAERGADVVVLCSDREPLGLCILEAMALERPVVTSLDSGAAEIINAGIDGFIVENGSPAKLATTLAEILESRVPQGLVEAARETIVKRASAHKAAHLTSEVYMELLDEWNACVRPRTRLTGVSVGE